MAGKRAADLWYYYEDWRMIAADMRKVEPGIFPVGDVRIACRVYGEGHPLLLIAGFGGTMGIWAPALLEKLSSRYRVIIFDNRGTGESTVSSAEFTMDLFSDDVFGLLEALDAVRAHVLGFSMGGCIAQELALRHPEMAGKLVLYAADCGGEEVVRPASEAVQMLAGASGSPREREEKLLGQLFPGKWLEENPDVRRYLPVPMKSPSAAVMGRQLRAMEEWRGSYGRLPGIKQPTLVITGTEDIMCPPANSSILARRVNGSRLVRIEGGGHGLMYQYPEKFGEILLSFLG